MKVAEYLTTKDYKYSHGVWDEKILPENTFVKPIDVRWLPAHIKDSREYRFFDPLTEVHVYCRHGIVVIPWSIIRKVE